MFGEFNVTFGHLPDFYTHNNYFNVCKLLWRNFLSDIATWSLIFEKCNIALERTAQDHTYVLSTIRCTKTSNINPVKIQLQRRKMRNARSLKTH